jgi:hypothetical protein
LNYLTFCYVPDTSYTSTTATTYRFCIDSTGALVGDKVGKYLKLYVDGGSTENTNVWSFNGSELKQINFKSGTNISLVGSSNAITVNTTSTITATAFYTSSDIKLKENIKPLSEHIREFNWKESGKKSYGIIAQELEKEYPELVIEKDDVKRVDYTAALCLLVAKLENRIKELENVIRNSN